MISAINSIYDVLGLSFPVTITAKLILSEVCLLKLRWHTAVPAEIQGEWTSWTNSLQKAPTLAVPRCVFKHNGIYFEIHGFEDASKVAVCAALYIVSYQDSTPVDHNLLAAKSRFAPKKMSIPRLELVAAQTLVTFKNNPTITGQTALQHPVGWRIVENGQCTQSGEDNWRVPNRWKGWSHQKILTCCGYVIERPQQLVCDLEIGGVSNDSSLSGGNTGPSGDVQQQRPAVRVRRKARHTTADRLAGIMAKENEED